MSSRSETISQYYARQFEFVKVMSVHSTSFKTYTIRPATAADIQIGLVEAAKSHVKSTLLRLQASEEGDHGLGYIIVDQGETRNWLLLHRWAYNDIVLASIASAPLGATDFQLEDHRQFHACVWEHVVIHHERNAWVKHMMSGSPEPKSYLGDHLKNGDY